MGSFYLFATFRSRISPATGFRVRLPLPRYHARHLLSRKGLVDAHVLATGAAYLANPSLIFFLFAATHFRNLRVLKFLVPALHHLKD